LNYGFTITVQGWHLLAKLIAGSKLEISRAMVGSGKLQDGINPGEIKELFEPVAQATLTLPIVEDRQVSFIVEYRSDLNGGLKEGFWLNEFGVFANDPDEGEILLYYANLGDYPQYVSPFNGSSVDIRRYPVSIALSDDVEVHLSYPAGAWMTSEDVAEYCSNMLDKFAGDIVKGVIEVSLTDRKGNILTTGRDEAIRASVKLNTAKLGIDDSESSEGLFVLIGRMIDAKIAAHNAATASHPDALYAIKK